MEKLKDYTLEVTVMDKDRIGRNECIGKEKWTIRRTYHVLRGFWDTKEALLRGSIGET